MKGKGKRLGPFTGKQMASILDDFTNHAENGAQLQPADAFDFKAFREKILAAEGLVAAFEDWTLPPEKFLEAIEAYKNAGADGGRRD